MSGELFLAIAGLVVGVVGIVVAVIEGRKYRGPLLCYQYHGSNLILSYDAIFPETIEVLFGGEKVPNLTHSQIVIWNRGSSPIKGNEVSINDPLRLNFGNEGEILQAEVVKITKESNKFIVDYKPRSKYIHISFDFLDRNDGALLSVWHTSREIDPQICGTLIHSKAGPFKLGRFIGPKPNVLEKKSKNGVFESAILRANEIVRTKPQIMAFVIIIAGLVLSVLSLFKYVQEKYKIVIPYLPLESELASNPQETYIIPVMFGIFYSAMGVYLWLQIRRRFPKKLLPEDYSTGE